MIMVFDNHLAPPTRYKRECSDTFVLLNMDCGLSYIDELVTYHATLFGESLKSEPVVLRWRDSRCAFANLLLARLYILKILALLLFENLQRIYCNFRLNGTQSKDVKWGVGVGGASFHGFVNNGSLWNLFWCFLCIFYYRNGPIFKTLGQFENLGFVIMSARENIRIIARAPYNYLFQRH